MTTIPTRNRILGAILAGGRATRMAGIAKGMLEVPDGRSVIQRLIDELARAGVDEVIVAANDSRPYRHLGRQIVPDIRADLGPLGGIEAALAWSARPPRRFDAVVFLPCDLPAITASEISTLIAAFKAGEAQIFVAETGKDFSEALCCIVHNDILPDISARIDCGRRGVRKAWRSLAAAAVHFDDEAAFTNINTPDDMDRWKAARRKGL